MYIDQTLFLYLFSCRAFKAPFYIGVVVPFVLIYLFNWIIFVVIIVSLSRKKLLLKLNDVKMKKDSKVLKQQLMIAITLSILFGLGWGLGLFVTEDIYTNKTVYDVLASVFVFLTGFHGLFLFIIYCLRSKEARFVWKNVLFCRKGKEFSTSNFNRIHKTSTGLTTMSHNLAASLKKDQAYKFDEDSQMRLYDYSKKNKKNEAGQKKELNKGEGHVDLNIPNDDGQATLRFYAKKYQDQFDIVETEAISKVESESQEPQYAIRNFGDSRSNEIIKEATPMKLFTVDEEHF